MQLFRLVAIIAAPVSGVAISEHTTVTETAATEAVETVAPVKEVKPELTLTEVVAQLGQKKRGFSDGDVLKNSVRRPSEQQRVGGCLFDAADSLTKEKKVDKGFLKSFRRQAATCCTKDTAACIEDVDPAYSALSAVLLAYDANSTKEAIPEIVGQLLAGARKRVSKDILKKKFAALHDKCIGEGCTWEQLLQVETVDATVDATAATAEAVATDKTEATPKQKKQMPATLSEMLALIDSGATENDFEVFKDVFVKAQRPTEEKAQVGGCLLHKVASLVGDKPKNWVLRLQLEQLGSCCTKDREACIGEVDGSYAELAQAYAGTKPFAEAMPLIASQLLLAVRSRIPAEGLRKSAQQLYSKCTDAEQVCTMEILTGVSAVVKREEANSTLSKRAEEF